MRGGIRNSENETSRTLVIGYLLWLRTLHGWVGNGASLPTFQDRMGHKKLIMIWPADFNPACPGGF